MDVRDHAPHPVLPVHPGPADQRVLLREIEFGPSRLVVEPRDCGDVFCCANASDTGLATCPLDPVITIFLPYSSPIG
jgi:hypothetical protein